MENSIFDTDQLAKTYFKMSVPVVMGLVVTIIYNLADTFFIAQTGNTNLVAGVSLCAPVFTILMAFGNIYGQGGSSLISRLMGKEDKEHVNKVSSFCFYIAIVTGIILGVLMFIFQDGLLHLIGANADTIGYAKEYYLVLAIGAPLCVLSFIHQNLVRCEGMATISMLGTMSGTILNIILDPILISVFSMGARGAAIATVLGYLMTDLFFIIVVLKKSKWLSMSISKAKACMDDLKQIFGIGITAAITNIMSSLCTIVINNSLLPFGNEKIAAMGIVLKVNMIAQLVLVGFSFGAVPLFGYLMGANNKEKVNELISFCLKFFTILSLTLAGIMIVLSPTLMKVMMDNASIIQDGTIMLRLQVAGTWFASIVLLMTCLCQASGKVLPSFLLSISRQGVLFIVVLFILSHLFGYMGIICSQFIADVLGAALALVIYRINFVKS